MLLYKAELIRKNSAVIFVRFELPLLFLFEQHSTNASYYFINFKRLLLVRPNLANVKWYKDNGYIYIYSRMLYTARAFAVREEIGFLFFGRVKSLEDLKFSAVL